MKPSVLCLFIFLLLSGLSSKAQNYGLDFNGSTSLVDAGNNALFNANTLRTLECWVKFNSLSGTQEIISKSDIGSGIELLVFGGNLAFYCMNSATSATSYLTYATSNLVTNRWYHIAASWDGTKESMRLYVNGIVVASVPNNIGNINVGGLSNPGNLRLGQWNNSENRFLNGQLDEVRIWSVARTQAEIKETMYGIRTNYPGLVAYYQFNEGSGTTATNATPNAGLDGTLTSIPASPATPPTYVNSAAAYSANGLAMSGGTDYATTATGNAAWNLTTTGTVECWIRPTAFTANINHCVWGVRGTTAKFSIHVAGVVGGLGVNKLGWFNGTYFELDYTFVPGTWYHLAFVVNGTTTTAYVNGVLLGTYPAGSGFGAGNNENLVVGRVQAGGSDFERYNGAVDELRIWNTIRTPAEINALKNLSINTPQTGLVANYSFNLGNPGADNTGLVNAYDNTLTNNHLTLLNFSLGSGSTSNYIANNLWVLPVTYTGFTATKQNGQAILEWQTATETNSAHFIVERSSDGDNYQSLGQVAAAGNATFQHSYAFTDRNPTNGINFYRLKQVDLNGAANYSAVRTLNFSSAARLQWYASGAHTVEIRLDKGSNETYQLVDLKGSVLKTGNLRSGRTHFSNLRPGTYIIRVKGTELMTQPFIVQ